MALSRFAKIASSFLYLKTPVLGYAFITRRPIRRGSIRSKSGSQKSNVISLPAASLRRSKIWIVKSCAISAPTIAKPIRLNGLTKTLLIASNPLSKSMIHCTRPKISVFRMRATNFVSDPDKFSQSGAKVQVAGHGKDKLASGNEK